MGDTDRLGIGVMLRMLGGDGGRTGRAVAHAKGRRVAVAAMDRCGGSEGSCVVITFDDGSAVTLQDGGQSCCESRYMTTDDDLSTMAGETIVAIEEREMADATGGDECHEQVALVITTDRAAYTIVNHNEHNGYYGGFALEASLTES